MRRLIAFTLFVGFLWLMPLNTLLQQDLYHAYAAPSFSPGNFHPLGTMENGFDLLVLLMMSLRYGLGMALLASLFTLPLSLAFAYAMKWKTIHIFTHAFLALPGLLWSACIVAAIGQSGPGGLMFALVIPGSLFFAKLLWDIQIPLRHKTFFYSAITLGQTDWNLFSKHLLPNLKMPMMVQGTQWIAQALLFETTLSYLGIGSQMSFGRLLKEASGIWMIRSTPLIFVATVLMATTYFLFDLANRIQKTDIQPRNNLT